MKNIWIAMATFFNVGRIPIAPGTWASMITAGIFYLLVPYIQNPITGILSLILITILGIPAATASEVYFKRKDPGECVIDEVAGQLLCLIFIPHSWPYYLAAFFIFRFFDILKPFPIRRAEKIGRGLGIMLDDLIAGIYTLAVIRLYIWIAPMLF